MELSRAELTLIMFALSTIVSGLVAFLVWLFKRVSENERSLLQYRIEAAEKYAHKIEINNLADRLEKKIDDLFSKIYESKNR